MRRPVARLATAAALLVASAALAQKDTAALTKIKKEVQAKLGTAKDGTFVVVVAVTKLRGTPAGFSVPEAVGVRLKAVEGRDEAADAVAQVMRFKPVGGPKPKKDDFAPRHDVAYQFIGRFPPGQEEDAEAVRSKLEEAALSGGGGRTPVRVEVTHKGKRYGVDFQKLIARHREAVVSGSPVTVKKFDGKDALSLKEFLYGGDGN